MCELQWDVLAEIHLKGQENPLETSCLCSRVFIRKDNLKTTNTTELSASEDDTPVDEEFTSELERSGTSNASKTTSRQDTEQETLSCYCSASHTDNLSTDEHDSLRDTQETSTAIKGLQQSDSGADLTECIKYDIESDWQKFWSVNGEKLIWESWITKYSAYINPEYLQYSQDQSSGELENKSASISNESNNKFSFDEKDLRSFTNKESKSSFDGDGKSRLLKRELSDSDEKLFFEVSEGWNPLSPISVDCETEAERLLSSRCGSHASSSLRTVDSMTNVTRMTVSSIDLSHSTSSSDSFSSVSSVQSSLSSEESEEDYQHQWHVLWKKHYEEEYKEQYNKFITTIEGIDISKVVGNKFIKNSNSQTSILKKNLHKVFQGKIDDKDSNKTIVSSLGSLLFNLKMNESKKNQDVPQEVSPSDNEDDNTIYTEISDMASLGLPTSFGRSYIKSKNNCIPELNIPLKDESFVSGRNRVRAAFTLIGIEFQENQAQMTGQVDYKMKHIRLQNRHLKIRPSCKKSKHTYFDDAGNAIPDLDDMKTYEEPTLQSILSDSTDEEIVSASTTPPKVDEKSDEPVVGKRKKRKKKPSFPPEIKENSKLRKYWQRRFSLFSKFDQGIKLDEESWYSVTPEAVAKHTAERCKCNVIIDAFCGAGGNTIQFAQTCNKVIAIDIDPKKIEIARNNAEVYGVTNKIDFIVGDFLQLAAGLKADVVFLSPPWGGPAYLNQEIYELEKMLLPVPLSELLKAARLITKNVAAFLPRNSNTFALVAEAGLEKRKSVEIEQNFLNKKLIAVTAYYNDLIKQT